MKEIDWTKVKSGDRFTAEIQGVKCEGKINKEKKKIYLCQNEKSGDLCSKRFGYKFSWTILDGSSDQLKLWNIDVTNLKIISQTKKPMAKKTTTRKTVIRTFKTSNRSKWEIVKAVTGDKTEYFCRLTSRNGNILSTGRGMNNVQNAIKNIKAVMNSCKVVEPTVGKIKK